MTPVPATAQEATLAPSAPAPPSEASMRLDALLAHQRIAVDQLVAMEAQRASLAAEARRTSGAQRQAAARTIADNESAIATTQADLAATRAKIAEVQRTMATEGSALPAMPPMAEMPGFGMLMHEERIFGMSKDEVVVGGTFLLLLPLALAFARLVWRRGTRAGAPAIAAADPDRFSLEQAVESIAIEVERIGEGQRFTTKMLTDRQGETPPIAGARRTP